MAFEFIREQLTERERQGLLRTRVSVDATDGALMSVDGQGYLNFSSNDYLGLRSNPEVMQAFANGLALYGNGSGASPLVTGYSKAHRQLEDTLSELLNRDAVLLFNSGFAANQAICQALLNARTLVCADKLMHASFLDGAMASEARFRRFRHNDVSHLDTLLGDDADNKLVVTESVFSMDGDSPDMPRIVDVTQRHSAWLMIDDAHGFGVLGDNGLGAAEHWQLSAQQAPILMGTLGKALGTAGAFVAASQDVIDYLVNFARHYVYSTAMPPAQAHATLTSLSVMQHSDCREVLHGNIALFRSLAAQAGLPLMPSQSAIQPLLIGDPQRAVTCSEKLRALGLWVSAIRYPTVPKHADRLRITLTAAHTRRDIEALVEALQLTLGRVSDEVGHG